MPILKSNYRAPWYFLGNGDLQTILPSNFRKIEGIEYQRERIFTPDQDFLDLDWAKNGSDRLMIFSHGLEGNSSRHYAKGMIKIFKNAGYDGLAWNCRTCSGEMNWKPRFYHHGASDDLACVIDHVLAKNQYKKIVLVGASMGGNLVLKYLGEQKENLNPVIKKAFTISVPCDLETCATHLEKPRYKIYNDKFMKALKAKMLLKSEKFAEIKAEHLPKIKYFRDFDFYYTAPVHGFESPEVFYKTVSSRFYLPDIQIPSYILTAQNDPILSKECYPIEIAKKFENIFLELPKQGGHVGFSLANSEHTYSEKKALEWAEK
ncbi:MAG: alpha/beta fold hydrolase [Bacteroidetes bacterium]|nr:MAG: alpha/beta fold hydrolase [Bacteroidota bacterium]